MTSPKLFHHHQDCLLTTQQSTSQSPARKTRTSYNRTLIALRRGRPAVTCSFTPVNVLLFQSPDGVQPYKLHGHTLESVTTSKYLGVKLHKEVTWDQHIDAITVKASKALGFLRRNLKVSSSELREKAYLIFVRPLLEYASSV
eukprot:TRINITY_DN35603_c0_g1_i2.p1 TRINITY_DN35603_c0_g1~~TRINITY_DN35603_c0_g1_i2.p1  ORF type:complete len:143 (+),score=24.63 TRINITY_DN35603_c0_g1_i2:60-488(+)